MTLDQNGNYIPGHEALSMVDKAAELIDCLALTPPPARLLLRLVEIARLTVQHGCVGPQVENILLRKEEAEQ